MVEVDRSVVYGLRCTSQGTVRRHDGMLRINEVQKRAVPDAQIAILVSIRRYDALDISLVEAVDGSFIKQLGEDGRFTGICPMPVFSANQIRTLGYDVGCDQQAIEIVQNTAKNVEVLLAVFSDMLLSSQQPRIVQTHHEYEQQVCVDDPFHDARYSYETTSPLSSEIVTVLYVRKSRTVSYTHLTLPTN